VLVKTCKKRGSSLRRLATGICEFQILVQVGSEVKRLCKFTFCKSDASIYLIPYATGGEYYFGGQRLPEHKASRSFGFTEQLSAATAPKVSIHESGRVHIRVGREQAGPLSIPPLGNLRGEHVATICVDRFDRLPTANRPPRKSGRAVDVTISVPDNVHSGRFPLYLNGAAPDFKSSNIQLYVRLSRPSLRAPLYLGIAPLEQKAVADPRAKQGVTVICGWDPSNPTDFLYLRGQ
jgi:hypothetical protein